ncbi:MAG: aldo/keto reductase [Myxococcota bacterium]|nr:aldo/keto reductase [Myxococcota bacterium]
MTDPTPFPIPRPGILRRELLKAGAAGAATLLAPAVGSGADAAEPRVRRYVPLGRTDLKISDVSFGSSRMRDPKVVRHAYERGVNYFDSAEGYKGGRSEAAIGEALHDVRDRVYITSKTKAEADDRVEDMMRALEGSLRRLRTDYVDVYFNHAVNEVDRMANPEWGEFTERAKEQGKIRYRGLSGHAGKLIESIDYGLDHGLLDVILVAYNFGQDPAFYQRFLTTFDFITLQPELPRVLERARKEGVGTVAMKTLMGARANDMRPYEREGGTFAQAAFRWVLSDRNVDALVISMNEPEMVDEFLGASGSTQVSRRDLELLGRYAAMNGRAYCQHGCGLCETSCTSGVAISEVLRTRMYAVDYGDLEFAREEYAQLAHDASPCLACDGSPCAGACPNGIPIARLTREAARTLG